MESVKVRIARHDPQTNTSGWSNFEVEVHEKTTVLDCLDRILRTLDPSLGFRYACRVGMCGSCAMVVNGKDRWTCRTLVRSLGTSELTLEPLRHMPVIRDLAVDFNAFWEKYRQVRPAFEPRDTSAKRVSKLDARRRRERIEPNIQCISCGICYSACGYVGTDPLYLGPHALNRAFTVIEDPRGGAAEARLKIVDNEHGCWKCHIQMNCTETCPMELSPSAAIQHLKREILKRRVMNPTRRKFAYTALGAAVAAVAGYVAYIPREWVPVGPPESIPSNTFQLFSHQGRYAFLRRSAGGDIEAMSQRCSHQGCRVDWAGDENEFRCPCHHGVFDSAGVPISGPPIRPLERFQTRIKAGTLEIFI